MVNQLSKGEVKVGGVITEKIVLGGVQMNDTNLSGVTSSATELNQLHSQGAVAADFAKLHAITATAAEVNKTAGVTGGTAAASKAVVLDANKEVRGIGIGNAVSAAAGDGAIAQKTGSVYITKGTAAALTIADPTPTTDDGCRLLIMSTTAAAHTVSNAAGSGFNVGAAAKDVGTFGAAIGNNMLIEAYQGKWYVISSVGVTLG